MCDPDPLTQFVDAVLWLWFCWQLTKTLLRAVDWLTNHLARLLRKEGYDE